MSTELTASRNVYIIGQMYRILPRKPLEIRHFLLSDMPSHRRTRMYRCVRSTPRAHLVHEQNTCPQVLRGTRP
ncbi:hypothetical protein ATCV1_z008R [Acanthocystis turfacea chlorella virus 1]|uniref:Uncharacterized protein z008R n=1 Tax=Chlorovirus heliozoae TaxID=322019 RepID=A7K7W8_9PHYC|nr:hypothetical protein ATCV1_z008R [Acanthocystis turfacea chlorella virus 1]ABT16142.1 hypothetical protein ATCV1_z008R [Acanthocystis turfacea chlorella virus 1]